MNLLYISDHRFIKCNNGDIYTTGQMGENYFYKFKSNFEYVTVLGLFENECEKNSKKKVQKLELNSDFVKYIFIENPRKIPGYLFPFKTLKHRFLELINGYDVIATKLPSKISYDVVKFTKKYNKPLFIEMVGCPWGTLWNHSLKGKIAAPIMWYLTRKSIRNAPYVMYVTEKFLQNRYPTKGKSIGCSDVTLPNLNYCLLEKRIKKIEDMKLKDPIILGTIAAVNVRYKGQQYVIRALSRLINKGLNIEYHLVGGGSPEYLINIAKKYGVEKYVKFLGSIRHDQVFEYLDNIDVYIQPSMQEGLPRALIEAMSRGLPAIGTNVGGIPELLEKECIVKKKSVDDLVDKLISLDKEKLIYYAKRNFEEAKKYEKKMLDTKRKIFLNQIYDQSGKDVQNN